MKAKKAAFFFLLSVTVCFLYASLCQSGDEEFPLKPSVMSKINKLSNPGFKSDLSCEKYLEGVERIGAEGFADLTPFFVTKRKGALSYYPCLDCHETPLSELKAQNQGMHEEIELRHSDVMSCTLCHNPQNMNSLRSLKGEKIDFDHSYQLCFQCHSDKKENWSHGTHGKRLGGWAEPRVINNCTACHTVHDPKGSFPKRLPSFESRIVHHPKVEDRGAE